MTGHSAGVPMMLVCAIVSAITDLRSGLIYDAITGVTALTIVMCAVLTHTVLFSLAGAAACAIPMFILHAGTRGRGLGLGDVKLSAVIGAGLGGVSAVGALGVAFVAGALWAVPLLLLGYARRGERVAFGPFLAIGAITACIVRALTSNG